MNKIVIELIDANVPPKVWINGVEVSINRLNYLFESCDFAVDESFKHEFNIKLGNDKDMGYAFIK